MKCKSADGLRAFGWSGDTRREDTRSILEAGHDDGNDEPMCADRGLPTPGGGYVLRTECGTPWNAKPENVNAIVDAASKYGRY